LDASAISGLEKAAEEMKVAAAPAGK
jgi:hypothetical protein